MNAAVTAYGLTVDGNEGARRALRSFWEAVADRGTWSNMQPSWIDRLKGPGSLDYSPGWVMMDLLSRVLSPYQMNPANFHPLRDILGEQVDFAVLSETDKVKLFVCASNVITKQVPQTAQAILDRINTLSFNSSLMREMRAINFVNRLVDRGFDEGGRLRKILVHCIDAEDEMSNLGVSSKLNVERQFLHRLFDLGRSRAQAFLTGHFDRIGIVSSTSIEERFPLSMKGAEFP